MSSIATSTNQLSILNELYGDPWHEVKEAKPELLRRIAALSEFERIMRRLDMDYINRYHVYACLQHCDFGPKFNNSLIEYCKAQPDYCPSLIGAMYNSNPFLKMMPKNNFVGAKLIVPLMSSDDAK